jgi:REP element-mobilizing transposase RayT
VNYDSRIHHRRSVRLAGFDYRHPGAYFVTVCTYERRCIFEDADLKAVPEEVWHTVIGASGGFIDDFVVMPNHVHGIVWIADRSAVGARQPGGRLEEPGRPTSAASNTDDAVASPLRTAVGPPSGSLGAIVGSFKSATAKRINNLRNSPGAPIWQRNYHEHIIRNDDDLARIRQYIRDNPAKWADDPDNPANIPAGGHPAVNRP